MFFRAIVASIAILLLGAGAGYGDLVIDIGDLELVPGGTGYLDVSVSGAGGGQTLNAYAFEYRITKTSGVGRLEFVSPQPSYLTDSDYVFFGNSFDYENGQSVGTVSQTSVPNDTFSGGDLTNDSSNVTVSAAKLLARLQVTANTALPPQVGDTYSISLISSGTGFSDTGGSVNWSSDSGTITMTPEPGSLVAILSGGVCLAALGWCRSCRRRPRRK